jgi:hypothetical protein
MRASRDLEAGIVFINNYNRQFMGTPFGGVKASGYGREHCVQTLQEFGYIKAVRTLSERGEPLQWPAPQRVDVSVLRPHPASLMRRRMS